jgi:hypothetical protein
MLVQLTLLVPKCPHARRHRSPLASSALGRPAGPHLHRGHAARARRRSAVRGGRDRRADTSSAWRSLHRAPVIRRPGSGRSHARHPGGRCTSLRDGMLSARRTLPPDANLDTSLLGTAALLSRSTNVSLRTMAQRQDEPIWVGKSDNLPGPRRQNPMHREAKRKWGLTEVKYHRNQSLPCDAAIVACPRIVNPPQSALRTHNKIRENIR